MKFISWNVNGLRACINKGFLEYFQQQEADFFCLQETKMQPNQVDFSLPGYEMYWNSAEKKGYSGTAIFTRHHPLSVTYDIGDDAHKGEGRCITLEMEDFYLVTVYTPNAQRELVRIGYRMEWEDAFRRYLMELDAKKPVIVCGDMNVAHRPIDLKNPKPNIGSAGYSYEERGKFSELLASGFADTFRTLHPEEAGAYTWWSYMGKARANNTGWRIDYFLVSQRFLHRVEESSIDSQILGSDHCPVKLLVTEKP